MKRLIIALAIAGLVPGTVFGQSLGQKKMQQAEEESFKPEVAQANEQCGSTFTGSFDWSGLDYEKYVAGNFSASGYCESALDAITGVCDDDLGKEAVKTKIKSVVCSFGTSRSIDLTDGTLKYVISFDSNNDVDFVREFLLKKL